MPKLNLTDANVRAIKPDTKRAEYFDLASPGLCLRVEPTGRKVWAMRYSVGGDKKRIVLGDYPDTSLKAARDRATATRDSVRVGGDPAAERKTRVEERKTALDIDGLIDRYAVHIGRRLKSAGQVTAILDREIRPAFGKRKAGDIGKRDCAELISGKAASAAIAANRMHSAMSGLFKFAVDQGLLEDSPMLGVKKAVSEKHEDVQRVLSDAELVCLWKAIDATVRIAPSVKAAFKTMALTGQRSNEVCGLEVRELYDLDGPEARIEFPASRMKGKRPHIVPLAPEVVAILDAMTALHPTEHVFTSRFSDRSAIARHSMSQAFRRVIDALDDSDPVAATLKQNPPTPHSLRRTTVSGMARLKIPRDHRKAVVAHKESDVHSRYDAYDLLTEKRAALEAWARHVTGLVEGRATGTVVPLRRA